MPSPSSQSAVADEGTDPREVYQSFVRIVDYHTGGSMAPISPIPPLLGTATRAGHGHDAVYRAISAACSNGDLFRWRDTRNDKVYLGIDDADTLVEKIGEYTERADEPRKDLIGIANQRVQHLRGEGGE